MEKNIVDLRKELFGHKNEFNLIQKIPCSLRENKEFSRILKQGGRLPEGVCPYVYGNGDVSSTEFYTVYYSDLSEAETREYLMYKQLNLLNTIKKCAVFFTVLTIIELVAAFILVNNML